MKKEDVSRGVSFVVDDNSAKLQLNLTVTLKLDEYVRPLSIEEIKTEILIEMISYLKERMSVDLYGNN